MFVIAKHSAIWPSRATTFGLPTKLQARYQDDMGLTVEWIEADIEDLPLADESFDTDPGSTAAWTGCAETSGRRGRALDTVIDWRPPP
jgi:hypothetical protein